MGSGLDWQDIVEPLSKEYYCLAVDLPGHGLTKVHGSITDYSMESFARSFSVFVKKMNINRPILLGYSMGGRMALFLSVYFTNLWSAAIFESATPGLRQEKQRVERRAKDGKIIKKLERENLEYFLKDWYQQPLFKSIKNASGFDSLITKRLDNEPEELIKSLKMMGVGVQPSLWEACSKIKIPVLLLAGEFDRKFCNIIQDMKTINPEFEISFVNNAGHNVHFEQPELFYRHINKFLNRNRENVT
jgi:2-succinyl-6-hydroxy-2,4-cyclohexadiene-1-carboxylate synthase